MIDVGLTVFMIVCTSLVMLMTPGLAFFYGGLACKKNILNVMIQSFVSMGWTSILWYAFGYSLCFSGGEGQIIGDLQKAFYHGVTPDALFSQEKRFPEIVFIAYQMMFAIITPALITGAFANRITFKAFFIFLTFWQILVYYPFAHMIWGNGLLAKWGVLDFAGGIVVHATAGFAALASVIYVGERRVKHDRPNNLPLVAIGTALLWFGWYGFNAGSELNVNRITALSFINTDLAASVGAVTWMCIEWFGSHKRPTFVGLLTGSVAGLATVTPAAGYISYESAFLIGMLGSIVCYWAVKLKNRMGWDDALDVWGVHGVGGVVGTVLLGVLGSKAINPNGADGLIFGGTEFFFKELIAVVATSAYAYLFTYYMLVLINKITRVKVTAEEEEQGLDSIYHGEVARD
ncbi:MAG: ammonium transporter [bacterium]|jgi:Amt family ammonium transporter|nr:ammonium transporter [Chitinophagaceae bacterium]